MNRTQREGIWAVSPLLTVSSTMKPIADTRNTRQWPTFISPSVSSDELSVCTRVDDSMRYGERAGHKQCFAFKGEVASHTSAALILSY